MEIRKTAKKDFERVMEIYRAAQRFMAEHGNPSQWGTVYPPEEMVLGDIADGASYVCIYEDKIVGVFYFKVGRDSVYKHIYEGGWGDHSEYGVVHHIASVKKGTGGFCLDYCFGMYPHIRIDTHADNIPMQRLIKKHGFKYCGKIYMPDDGTERIAFEKSRECCIK